MSVDIYCKASLIILRLKFISKTFPIFLVFFIHILKSLSVIFLYTFLQPFLLNSRYMSWVGLILFFTIQYV